jgi:4-amino-4-deoxy-L-arabinose transferase-like glycosyltransferase
VKAEGRGLHRALPVAVALGTLALAAIPAWWRADPSPYPDALEYALTARALAHGEGYWIPIFNGRYPPHYPIGFPALLAPWYWLPGASLTAGLYGVALFAAATAAGVYLLGRRTGGIAGALAGAAAVALSARFLDWSHRVMSETATAALVAGVALALARHAAAATERSRERWVVALGLLCGLGVVTRFANAVLLAAVGIALLLDPRVRARLGRSAVLLALGPAVAVSALGWYAWRTFGDIGMTGYEWWGYRFHDSLAQTFALRYALVLPGASDHGATQPNWLFYPWDALPQLFPPLLLGAGILGLGLALRRRAPAARSVAVFALVTTVLTLALYTFYFFQSARFVAPLVPLVAFGVGMAMGQGIEWLRARGTVVRLAGAGIVGIVLVTLAGMVGPALAESFLWQRGVRRDRSLYVEPTQSVTSALYRRAVPAGSVVFTNVQVPLLDVAGVPRGVSVFPMTRGWYWYGPPLLAFPTFAEQQRMVRARLAAGQGVYTDALTLEALRADSVEPAAPRTLRLLDRYDLTPVAREGSATLYRLALRDGRERGVGGHRRGP